MDLIELVDIEKTFRGISVLKGISLSIKKGEFVTLLGPSGSGKTTILRLLAGFEWLTRGKIKLNDRDIKDLEPYNRDLSMIFQDYALIPHLNVADNIKFGLKLARKPLENISSKVKERLKFKKEFWEEKSKRKKQKIIFRQKLLRKYLSVAKNNWKIERLQNKIDDLDFNYSYWENYPDLKLKKFSYRNLTRKLTKTEVEKSFQDMVNIVGLCGNTDKQIHEISGGMKQRVALARSLIIEPEILLLDEPLSALDAKLRVSMRNFLKKIQRKLGKTFILVTHDQEEALELSDRIAIINDGSLVQFATPKEIYDYPKNKWVASFIGNSNIYKTKVIEKGKILLFGEEISYSLSDPAYQFFNQGDIVDCLIRPEDVDISKEETGFLAKIISINYKGSYYYLVLQIKDQIIEAETSDFYELNQEVFVFFDVDAIHLMFPEGAEVQS